MATSSFQTENTKEKEAHDNATDQTPSADMGNAARTNTGRVKMAWFEHNGSRIYYEEQGTGTAVLVLPGFAGNIEEFAVPAGRPGGGRLPGHRSRFARFRPLGAAAA